MKTLLQILALCVVGLAATAVEAQDRLPNVVVIMADDLGYNEVGAYGQTKIKTPRIDQLARQGMRFTQYYSGSPVCASSRCVLLTGKHTGHAFVRGNKEIGGWGPDEPEGQLPLPDSEITLAELLKSQGYATGAFGKWGLGGPGSTGHPCYQGFDRFYGYLCQRVAHNYYPTHLWSNHDVDVLGNPYFAAHQKIDEPLNETEEYWQRFQGPIYATDRMIDKAVEFIDEHQDDPFFLYYATPVPHVSLQVPNDSLVEYEGAFPETPYLGEKAYLPHPTPRAAYAAMVTRMDRNIGRILDRLEALNLSDDTIVVFTSDNGPTFNGGTDSTFFESAGPLRGLKVDVLEGGIRVPMIVRWPGKIQPDQTSEFVCSAQDLMPTLLEVCGGQSPNGSDGISLIPTLTGRPENQQAHEYLYWELGRQQAVRSGDWKLVRLTNKDGSTRTMLYNLGKDIGETTNLAEKFPEVLEKMLALARAGRHPSKEFPSVYDDGR